MSPSDKNKTNESSMSGERTKPQTMDSPSESASSSISDVTIPGHGMIANIPLITASLPTLKCSIKDQMKTFDPGEDGGIERLNSNHCGNSNSSVQNKNSNNTLTKSQSKKYIAGSKINKLADMLAKRSQSVVEVTQNNATDIITDISGAVKVEEAVILNNVSNIMNLDKNSNGFDKTADDEELDEFRKNRRKSVPNQSCNRLQIQSTSKSCSDFSKLFPTERKLDHNALGGSLNKLQTDESTKKKAVRKNLKNVELPLILPKRKRRSLRNENLVSNKKVDKILGKNRETHGSVVSTKKASKKPRRSKKLVETSTQTTDIEFITVLKPEIAEESSSYDCFYCTRTFISAAECKAHEKTHSLKKFLKCQFCSKKLLSLDDLKLHCIEKHPKKYAYCIECDESFADKEELYSHNKEIHMNKTDEVIVEEEEEKKMESEDRGDKKMAKQNGVKDLKVDVTYDSSKKSSVSPRNNQKVSPKEIKTEEQLLELEMLFYSNLSGNIQENLTNHLDGKMDKCGNPVRTDQIKEPDVLPVKAKSSSLSVDTPSTVPDVQVARAPSPYQTRSKTPNPLPPTAKKFKKLPNWQQKFWEKYNFPTNYRYEHRFWDKNYLNTEKSAFHLKDLSCLDIKTQLTMRENIKKLDKIKLAEESSKTNDKFKFPEYLSLMPSSSTPEDEASKSGLDAKTKKPVRKEELKKFFKSPGSELTSTKSRRKLSADSSAKKSGEKNGEKMMTRRQSSIDLLKEEREDEGKKKEGNPKSGQRMSLRRQTSLENFQESKPTEKPEQVLECNVNNVTEENTPPSPTGSAEISGEWVRPRSYLCGTCCAKFTNLWELEDHKWVSHPNVWCTHYEFEDEKIDKLFHKNEDEEAAASSETSLSKLKLTDLYKRYLLPHGSLKTAKLVPNTNFPEACTKCKKSCMNPAEMHKHMLDCGGDTTWFLTMYSSPMSIKRKWRPFGSRRRKQLGRRDLKRNIPSTPNIRSPYYQHRIRTKPGDVESIQKMLANLPEKRARRAINFDDIKTRSQATIHSNRLLRKRFRSSFTNNFLKFKNLKQKRLLKPSRKEESSRSTTDTSSESTPTGSPKRRIKLKDSILFKDINSREASSEGSGVTETKTVKKKIQKKKAEFAVNSDQVKPVVKTEKSKVKKVKSSSKCKEFASSLNEAKFRKKTVPLSPIIKQEVLDEPELKLEVPEAKISFAIPKTSKKSKKKVTKTSKNPIKMEVMDSSDITQPINQEVKVAKAVIKKKKTEKVVKKEKQKVPTVALFRLSPNKEKAELLKMIKKKFQNSKKILKAKEKNKNAGSRRSQRLKSQQSVEENEKSFSPSPETKKEEIQKELKTKKVETQNILNPGSSRSVTPSKPVSPAKIKKFKKLGPVENFLSFHTFNMSFNPEGPSKMAKTPKRSKAIQSVENDQKQTKVIEPAEDNIKNLKETPKRRSSRSSRNSCDELKFDYFQNGECFETPKKASSSRGNSKSLSDVTELVIPKTEEEISKKSSRVQNVRKSINEKPELILANGQIPSTKKFQISASTPKVPTKEELIIPGSSDEEMPILAKVEPIQGKVSRKSEKEIPILSPVERVEEPKVSPTTEDVVSFQVIKKRKKASKELTPLKIVKKVKNVGAESGIQRSLFLDDSNATVSKTKKRRLESVTAERPEKITQIGVKKYFLGICPSEIDKGRKSNPEESGSDSEPLIALVKNQPQNENKLVGVKEKLPTLSGVKEEPKKLKKPKKKRNKIQFVPQPIQKTMKVEDMFKTVMIPPPLVTVPSFPASQFPIKLRKKIKMKKKKKKVSKTVPDRLLMTVTLKEPTLKIIDKPLGPPTENKWAIKIPEPIVEVKQMPEPPKEEPTLEVKNSVLPERRSRRISKETKTTNEFIIDDPLILVDELWSDLDSDSDSSKKKTKKGKKKLLKKKSEDKRKTDVNLEELLRNFGENKEVNAIKGIKVVKKPICWSHARNFVENRKELKSYKRLSLKLFRFNKNRNKFGYCGIRLSEAKKALQREENEKRSNRLPDLPFLAAEIKENPMQVIQCGVQKPKIVKKVQKKSEPNYKSGNFQMKISLPLEIINNMAIFNNNHLTELVVDVPNTTATENSPKTENETSQEKLPMKEIQPSQEESPSETETNDGKNKFKRSEFIDKIFSCELCQTYYYSSYQLRSHKLSNRHKAKELKLQMTEEEVVEDVVPGASAPEPTPTAENDPQDRVFEVIEAEKLNEDTLEMPILEGPFIENTPLREGIEPVEPITPAQVNSFEFSPESLKDIQRAIGCTDEEMLILTLLGDSTIKLENEILDLDTCKRIKLSEDIDIMGQKDLAKVNGIFKPDLKQRMTSALACLVNKAVFNLLQKYSNAAKSTVNPEAMSLLKKLLSLNRPKNIFQLNELLRKQCSIGGPIESFPLDRKEVTGSYKYQCTICGSRFEKASTREYHVSRSHKAKGKKVEEEPVPEDWSDSWSYDIADDHQVDTGSSQFWCSDCGINFLSPQEVLEHQKAEHQPTGKDSVKEAGPLQSSTIGSSDEIIEGKKAKRRPKVLSSEELDQQRIIANNELRKLDKKYKCKTKIKWGMDALKFTVEKENKMVVLEDKDVVEVGETSSVEIRNIDLVPKLNLSRTNNIPEFKVIQKNALKNRFQKIIGNKLKRKTNQLQHDSEAEDVETEVMLVPVVVKKKTRKPKAVECVTKKDEEEKPLDVYDFNEFESDNEPMVLSHVKKPTTTASKVKLIKAKEKPSKNKADSTTKDLSPDDYDSEDSLPLSVVKKSKPGEEDDEKVSEGGTEKKENILERVEYLIEQLENETGSKNEDIKDKDKEEEKDSSTEHSKDETINDKIYEFSPEVPFVAEIIPTETTESIKTMSEEEKIEQKENESILADQESSRSAFDEEDSMPLVLMTKRTDESKSSQEEKKIDESFTDVSTSNSEVAQIFKNGLKGSETMSSSDLGPLADESLPSVFCPSENEGTCVENPEKPFENLNGNLIYRRNESISDFGTESSNDGLIHSNFDKVNSKENDRSFIKEVTETEDVVIVCSKGDDECTNGKIKRKKLKTNQRKKKEKIECVQKRKKRYPLLTATIEENNFRKSESPKLNKEVIVRKIWSRRKAPEITDNEINSFASLSLESSTDCAKNDESQTEIEKEMIVKKIWNRKKVDHEDEIVQKVEESFSDIKINQTEVSDEVVIKCGPKAKTSPKRRKSRTSEASKETIMRKIWSGKCTFQTKAALKTYDSDMMTNCKENDMEGPTKPKKRGRPSAFGSTKRSKVGSDKDDEDDLDSLLEEIEREQLEKAIRLEFLQLRRSEKGNIENMKESSAPTLGLFTETTQKSKKELGEKKRRKVKKKINHPRQSVLGKKLLKKPIRRVVRPVEDTTLTDNNKTELVVEPSENSIEKNNESFGVESKIKIRKHKKHRHKHHHHKHKHKKSKHHKCMQMGKHKNKHKSESGLAEATDSFTLLEKICQDIPNQIENELNFQSKPSKKRMSPDSLSPFPFETNTKDCDDGLDDNAEKGRYETGNGNIYEFVEDVPELAPDGRSLKM